MFGKDSDETGGQQPLRERLVPGRAIEERRRTAWIGASIVVSGSVTSSEDMTVAGRVEGDVAVPEHTLAIAPGARIRGDIVARGVVIHGEVVGGITADRRVEVGETGSVTGDITTPQMVVAEGAALHGRLVIRATPPARKPTASGATGQPAAT